MPGLLQPPRKLTWSADGSRLVLVEIQSVFTGKWNAMELVNADEASAISRAQWDAWQSGQYIQDAMPQLSNEEREFLLTGATPDEWKAMTLQPEDE